MVEQLVRIAEALERQCEQHDAWRVVQIAWRDENVARSNYQHDTAAAMRDSELAEARAINEQLLAQIDSALQTNARILALYEAHELTRAADAVDPHAGSTGMPSTRDKTSS